jgi:hypothetical protein
VNKGKIWKENLVPYISPFLGTLISPILVWVTIWSQHIGIIFYRVCYIMFLDVHTTSFTSIYCRLMVSVGRKYYCGRLYFISREELT